MRRIVVVLLVLLVLPASAAAGVRLDTGSRVAFAKWGMPACGLPHFEWSTPRSYQGGVGDTVGEAVAWADASRCAIVFNLNVRIRTAVKYCHVIVHEWAHLTGYRDPTNTKDPQHSSNPLSVMAANDHVDEGHRLGHRAWVAANAYGPCYKAVSQPSTLAPVSSVK